MVCRLDIVNDLALYLISMGEKQLYEPKFQPHNMSRALFNKPYIKPKAQHRDHFSFSSLSPTGCLASNNSCYCFCWSPAHHSWFSSHHSIHGWLAPPSTSPTTTTSRPLLLACFNQFYLPDLL